VSSPKYPRTPHLPFSPGGTSDDRRIESVEGFLCGDVVVTEKMDGSNVCLEAGACFARTHAAKPNHESFSAFKALHATVSRRIPATIQVFGEWLYAKHSIKYTALPSYLMVFGVRDLATSQWASWSDVEMWAEELGVSTTPVLARESWLNRDWKVRDLVETYVTLPSRCGGVREGVVLRLAGSFADSAFETSVAKWVRKGHIQTDKHWKSGPVVRNGLIGTSPTP
jgi:hypothetical protein